MKTERIMQFAMLLAAVAVVTGAFGAHALRGKLEPDQLDAWKTAVLYQFLHVLAILILLVSVRTFSMNEKLIGIAAWCMMAGIVFFSGSIYFLTTRSLSGWSVSWMGPITPVGGLLLIAGWILAAFSVKKK